jgi:hypothetical protein
MSIRLPVAAHHVINFVSVHWVHPYHVVPLIVVIGVTMVACGWLKGLLVGKIVISSFSSQPPRGQVSTAIVNPSVWVIWIYPTPSALVSIVYRKLMNHPVVFK